MKQIIQSEANVGHCTRTLPDYILYATNLNRGEEYVQSKEQHYNKYECH